MKRTITISIPEPCHEQWDRMEPRCGGNYCQQCQKTVTDFTALTDQEILDKLSSTAGGVCGRFDVSQLDRVIAEESRSRRPILPIFALSSFLSMIFPGVLKAQRADTTVQVSKPLYDTSCVPFEFYGEILDAKDNTPIAGATIKCKGRYDIGGTSATDGKFHISIRPGLQRTPLIFEISQIGYETQTIPLNALTGSGPQQIKLNLLVKNLNELVVVGYGVQIKTGITGYVVCKRKFSWWHRFLDHFRGCKYHH
ncbi:MAG: carboxypeptidase-like regulatory domain-containing protein [Chitinophaga sp.]|uniref:carboxypeptidase-like regulatory domain-containing protein n=1 Tax=Chitinophaga sp. TaxID=1869181 RepID=UPI0025BF3C1D|nr:carboxypeptidase-like regulatory domain-containing protein [Chitinophaga sp.]MBV8254303.1 carboxypeptidase-like regulatory domain-containing protein [Chitinophaga sp.]